MSQYMLLIYMPVDGVPDGVEEPHSDRWAEYSQELVAAGLMRGGDRLHDVSAATTVRVRDGETLITDGPFAETKEFLAGYYLIEAPDLDTALERAARMPNSHYASIEVRPVFDMAAAASGASNGAQASA